MADPFFSSVVALVINDNQADGVTTFLDQETTPKTFTTFGNAQYDTGITPPTGMTSTGLFDGTGDYISAADSADWDFGTGDFTIEGFINPASTAGAACVMGQRTGIATEFSWLIYRSGTTLQVYLAAVPGAYNIWNAGTIGTVAAGNWYHFAVTRSGTNFYSYLAGVNGATTTSAAAFNNSGVAMTIGANVNAGEGYNGSLCSIRITKGVARYSGLGSFTPPTLPLPLGATAPVADFSGTPLSGNAPFSVAFTDLSTNTPTSWAWTFGDGGTAATQNPSHTYSRAGAYTVGLTATNSAGSDLETKTGYITATGDTHDGFDASDLNRKLDKQRAERDAERTANREHLRELLEAAFAPDAPAPVAEQIRKVAAPAVRRMESGRLAVDYAMIERRHLAARLEAFREAFAAEQAALIEDEEAALLLAGSLH